MAEMDPKAGLVVDRNLALELVRVTEAAALAASRWIGRRQQAGRLIICRQHHALVVAAGDRVLRDHDAAS